MRNKKLQWIVWILAAVFYFYEYLLRVAPSVMVHELMQSFQTNAAIVGIISAFYFYAYALMQLPVGIMMDRFGARKLLTFAAIICGLGNLLFGTAPLIWIANAGRFLVGIGSAFAFVGIVYVASHWFPPQKRAFTIGLANSIGMLGAVMGQGPLAATVSMWGWRESMIALGVFGFVLGAVIYFIVRNEPEAMQKAHEKKSASKGEGWMNMLSVVKNPHTWVNAIVALLFYLTTTALGGLWGIPFLQSAHNISKQTAGFAMSMIFVGWLVGGPIIGHFSDRMKKRKYVLIASIALTGLCLLPVIYIPHLSLPAIYVFLFLVGLFSSAELLNFSLAVELNIKEAKGTSAAFTNFLIAASGSLIQPLIGYILDLGWNGQMHKGSPVYSIGNYHLALGILPCCLAVAFVLAFFIKEQNKEVVPTIYND